MRRAHTYARAYRRTLRTHIYARLYLRVYLRVYTCGFTSRGAEHFDSADLNHLCAGIAGGGVSRLYVEHHNGRTRRERGRRSHRPVRPLTTADTTSLHLRVYVDPDRP